MTYSWSRLQKNFLPAIRCVLAYSYTALWRYNLQLAYSLALCTYSRPTFKKQQFSSRMLKCSHTENKGNGWKNKMTKHQLNASEWTFGLFLSNSLFWSVVRDSRTSFAYPSDDTTDDASDFLVRDSDEHLLTHGQKTSSEEIGTKECNSPVRCPFTVTCINKLKSVQCFLLKGYWVSISTHMKLV